ncbi:DUF1874 domain-containing protein [Candidatus Dependentiae bacterium]|nr:MAG: DUF1874 domain-containing protein [Candidatus Dependentiae bacterium]
MLYLFNTTIMPNEGVFINERISREKAYHIFWTQGHYNTAPQGLGATPDDLEPSFVSAIGHQGSADVLNLIFNPKQKIEVNRIPAQMKRGDAAIALKVLGRLPEGQVLSLRELEEIGYEFYYIRMIANDHNELESDAAHCGAAPITGSIWK